MDLSKLLQASQDDMKQGMDDWIEWVIYPVGLLLLILSVAGRRYVERSGRYMRMDGVTAFFQWCRSLSKWEWRLALCFSIWYSASHGYSCSR